MEINSTSGKIDFIFRKTNQPCTFIDSLQNRNELTPTIFEQTKEQIVENIHRSGYSESFNAIMASTENDPCLIAIIQIKQATFFFRPQSSNTIQQSIDRIQEVAAHISPFLDRLTKDEVRILLDIATSYEVFNNKYPPAHIAL